MDSVAFLNTSRNALIRAAVFGGGRAKGTLKILQELLNHGGLVAVVRAGITYLTSKCPAGAGSPFRILFHDRTLNHDASVALNDTVSCVLVECAFFLSRQSTFSPASLTEGNRELVLRNFRFNTCYTNKILNLRTKCQTNFEIIHVSQIKWMRFTIKD